MNLASHPSDLDSSSAFDVNRNAKTKKTPEAIIRNLSSTRKELTNLTAEVISNNFEKIGSISSINMAKIEKQIMETHPISSDTPLTSNQLEATIANIENGYYIQDIRQAA